MTVGEVYGRHTLEQMTERMDEVVSAGVAPHFLIPALVAHLDDFFERLSEDYAKGLANQRAAAATFREWADAGGPPDIEEHRIPGVPRLESTPEELRETANTMELMAVVTPTQLRERRQMLVKWREVSAPLVTEERMRAALWDGIRR